MSESEKDHSSLDQSSLIRTVLHVNFEEFDIMKPRIFLLYKKLMYHFVGFCRIVRNVFSLVHAKKLKILIGFLLSNLWRVWLISVLNIGLFVFFLSLTFFLICQMTRSSSKIEHDFVKKLNRKLICHVYL